MGPIWPVSSIIPHRIRMRKHMCQKRCPALVATTVCDQCPKVSMTRATSPGRVACPADIDATRTRQNCDAEAALGGCSVRRRLTSVGTLFVRVSRSMRQLSTASKARASSSAPSASTPASRIIWVRVGKAGEEKVRVSETCPGRPDHFAPLL